LTSLLRYFPKPPPASRSASTSIRYQHPGGKALLSRTNNDTAACPYPFIAVEGVDKLSISAASGRRPAGDVRSRISALANAPSISLRAFDVDGKMLGERKLDRPSGSKWDIPVVRGAIRYELN
jgi:hypothetical protein